MATDKFSELRKNTVDSCKQLDDSSYIKFINYNGKGKRVMFVGNSITLHGINEGVANHPGDKGMETIAKRIWEEIK